MTSTAVPSYTNYALRNAYMNSTAAAAASVVANGGSSLACKRKASMHRRGRSYDFDEVRSQTDLAGASGGVAEGTDGGAVDVTVSGAAATDLILPSYINQLAYRGGLLRNSPKNMSKSSNVYEDGDAEDGNYSTIESSYTVSPLVATLNRVNNDKKSEKNPSPPVSYNNLPSSSAADSPPPPPPSGAVAMGGGGGPHGGPFLKNCDPLSGNYWLYVVAVAR